MYVVMNYSEKTLHAVELKYHNYNPNRDAVSHAEGKWTMDWGHPNDPHNPHNDICIIVKY